MQFNRTWALVNLDNIAHNYRVFADHAKTSAVMCVIKANGYGHGSAALAHHLKSCGCGFFGVASLDEAIELAAAGIQEPILVLGYTLPSRVTELTAYGNIRLTVFDLETAAQISKLAEKTIKIHVKLDTGMTRIGFNVGDAAAGIEQISRMHNLEIEGLFTHFATADELDRSFTEKQFERYMRVVNELELNIPIKHVCNSAGTIMFPEMHLDMVRVGISLYGCYPSEDVDKSVVDLKPAMEFKTQIIRINEVDAGTGLSYGLTYITPRRSKIATIPIGYADGLSRVTAGKIKVLVNGAQAPIVGRICMDQCMVDVTDIPTDVKMLDEVTIFGNNLPVEQVASAMGTINYEILCMVGRRVPRYYTVKGKIVETKNYLI